MLFYIHLSDFFFFKQKTAYEVRISDWSSDVCSSDLDQSFALGQVITPAVFNRLIDGFSGDDRLPEIMEAILRSQTQAYYGPANAGHFGLALGSYAHFTSPIRRYADLIVHRALVDACKLDIPAIGRAHV